MKKVIDFYFEMENFYSETLTIYCFTDYSAMVKFFDCNTNEWKEKNFLNYDNAYDYCYNLGFRE